MKRAMRYFAAAVVGVLIAVLAGCGDDGEETTFPWPIAVDSPEDAVAYLMAKRFADECMRLSDNRLKLKVFPNATLGGDREALESCESGDIPFVVQITAPQLDFIPETVIFDLPCAFADIRQLRGTVNDPAFRAVVNNLYIRRGFRLLVMGDQGFRQMTANKPVRSLADFRGLKIRTMENAYHIAFWKSIGARPTPMNFGEVYIGLQQGTIDAGENSIDTLVAARLFEQQKYLVMTNHVPHLLTLIVSNAFYEELPPADRAILDEAARIAQEFAYEQTDARMEGRLRIVTDSGARILPLDPRTREEIIAASQPVYEMIRRAVGDELVDAMLDARPSAP